MSKYKAGDKFIIEIEDVLHIESDKGLWVEPWYMVNGMEGTFFEEDDLDSLDRYDETGKSEIKVGDILKHDSSEEYMLVTDVHGEYVSGVCTMGTVNRVGSTFYEKPKDRWLKTGHHFSIEDTLKQMRGE